MPSVICTLFEGHYHYGLAALVNSLYREGFRGTIYAGYKGKLPQWASGAKEDRLLHWNGSKTLHVAEGLKIHFLPIETSYNLTNYKPDFMLQLWNGPATDAKKMFYFDPDIVITRSWFIFEDWVSCGVAVSEDVNSPLSKMHPRRVAWRKYFISKGISLNFKDKIYVNGGFIGLSVENKPFLEIWKKVMEAMAPLIGGLEQSIFGGKYLSQLKQAGGHFMPFLKTDQDALNAAIEACEQEISFIGKDGMGFENGFIIMHHAVGRAKPWKRKSFRLSLAGRPPRKVDIEYWRSSSGPINAIPQTVVSRRRFALKVYTIIGRFYKLH